MLHIHAQDISAGPPPGTVISDDFSDPSRGIFPTSSTNPAYQEGYVGGEYQLAKIDPSASNPGLSVPGTFGDVLVDFDVRIVGDATNITVFVYCRRGDAGRYYMAVTPDQGLVTLNRADGSTLTAIAPSRRSSAVLSGNQTNHLELACVGTTISAKVNGWLLAQGQDDHYSAGQTMIVAGSGQPTTDHITSDVRLAHLIISVPAPGTLITSAPVSPAPSPVATASPPASGTVLKADSYTDPSKELFPKASQTPDDWTIGYTGGEYQIASAHPISGGQGQLVSSSGNPDVTVAVDVRLAASSDASTLVSIGCRRTGSGSSSTDYFLNFFPSDYGYNFGRQDPGGAVSFSNVLLAATNATITAHLPGAPISGATHHLTLTCSGSTISASIDGQQVGSVQDSTYKTGQVFLAAALASNSFFDPLADALEGTQNNAGTIDVRFSNFMLTQP